MARPPAPFRYGGALAPAIVYSSGSPPGDAAHTCLGRSLCSGAGRILPGEAGFRPDHLPDAAMTPDPVDTTPDAIERLPLAPPVRQALYRARAGLERLYGPRLERVVLFGSQARGDARPGSDIDLLVVLADQVDRHAELGRLGRLAWDVLQETDALVGFVVAGSARYAAAAAPLLRVIRREGRPL